jgi:hypothetical protein
MDNASLRSRAAEMPTRRDGALPPVLKVTQRVLIGLENALLYLILLGLSRMIF